MKNILRAVILLHYNLFIFPIDDERSDEKHPSAFILMYRTLLNFVEIDKPNAFLQKFQEKLIKIIILKLLLKF